MEHLSRFYERRPLLTLALTNGATAAWALWVVSEGRPLSLLSKLLFRAVMAAAPRSLVDAEMGKMRSKIEASVIGHAMDGEPSFHVLPAEATPTTEIVAALERGAPAVF
jgi:hypothetical protein